MNIDFQSIMPAQTLVSGPNKGEKLAKAAKDFEALMIEEVLKASRQSSDGSWLGTGEDQAGGLAVEMAEQQFAQALSAGGGLGIAKMVTANLQRGAARTANSGSPDSNSAAATNTDSTR